VRRAWSYGFACWPSTLALATRGNGAKLAHYVNNIGQAPANRPSSRALVRSASDHEAAGRTRQCHADVHTLPKAEFSVKDRRSPYRARRTDDHHPSRQRGDDHDHDPRRHDPCRLRRQRPSFPSTHEQLVAHLRAFRGRPQTGGRITTGPVTATDRSRNRCKSGRCTRSRALLRTSGPADGRGAAGTALRPSRRQTARRSHCTA
jgi:hypothetical protein